MPRTINPAHAAKVQKARKRITGAKARALRMAEQLGDGLRWRDNLTHKVDGWARYIWRERGHSDEQWVAEGQDRKIPGWEQFSREMFADLLAGQGKLQELPEDDQPASAGWAREAHRQLDEVGEYQQLREVCNDDPEWAAVGARRVAKAIRRKLQPECTTDPEALRELAEAVRERGERPTANHLESMAQEQQEAAERDAERQGEQGAAVRVAVREAAAEAAQTVEQGQQLLGMLGHGMGTAELGRSDEGMELKRQVAELLTTRPDLQEIVELAGRLQAAGGQARMEKIRTHAGAVVDVTRGADVARLCPGELARLATPELAPTLMRDIVERQAACYEMEGEQQADRGPIVLLVDCSGSMAGQRQSWAMGAVLAVYNMARRDKRVLAIGHYNSSLTDFGFYAPPAYGNGAVLDELMVGASGGTNLGAAMRECEEHVDRERELDAADYLVITDGQDSRPSSLEQVTAAGRSVWGVFIQCGAPDWAGDLDGYCEINDAQVRTGDDSEAAKLMLSGALS